MTCNQCCYSSIGRFQGVVQLHCGLAGCPLSEMPAQCKLGRRADAAAERYNFWTESETDDSARRLLPAPR
ncbi:MAG: hypothetical protein ACYC3S_15320 [Chloroflexota bacterium]